MNNFWNDIKQTLTSQKPELDETDKAILDIENKKKMIIQASNNEQTAIKEKISCEYRHIGETTYNLYETEGFEIEKIVGMFQTIKSLLQTLAEKKTKLNEILERYDEELRILRPLPQTRETTCPNCGNFYIPDEMFFCNKCGVKLPEKVSGADDGEPEAVQLSRCPDCNQVLVPDALFCAACGYKL